MATYNDCCEVLRRGTPITIVGYVPGQEFDHDQFQCPYTKHAFQGCGVEEGRCEYERGVLDDIMKLPVLLEKRRQEGQQRSA